MLDSDFYHQRALRPDTPKLLYAPIGHFYCQVASLGNIAMKIFIVYQHYMNSLHVFLCETFIHII